MMFEWLHLKSVFAFFSTLLSFPSMTPQRNDSRVDSTAIGTHVPADHRMGALSPNFTSSQSGGRLIHTSLHQSHTLPHNLMVVSPLFPFIILTFLFQSALM